MMIIIIIIIIFIEGAQIPMAVLSGSLIKVTEVINWWKVKTCSKMKKRVKIIKFAVKSTTFS